MTALILASSSPHRRQLLQRLGLPFRCFSPDVDETPQEEESPSGLALRLAKSKACTVQQNYPDAVIIGSDQVAHCEGKILTKPGTIERAKAQLQWCSAKTVHFHTGLCVLNGSRGTEHLQQISYTVVFRPLTDKQIASYIEKDCPLDCAGSFKSESLGISLFESMAGDDPTALVGLPLIALTRMLAAEGMDPLL